MSLIRRKFVGENAIDYTKVDSTIALTTELEAAISAEASSRSAAIAALPTPSTMMIQLTSEDLNRGYLDLGVKANNNIIVWSTSGVMFTKDMDFTMSLVNDLSRISFAAQYLSGGEQELVPGDKIGIFYLPLGTNSFVGPQGAQGPAGMTGANGATGSQGPVGATGAEGPMGYTGPAGATGAAGSQGPAGATGADGATGPVNSRVNSVAITNGSTSVSVTFSSAMSDSNYGINCVLVNTTDSSPQFQPIVITTKSTAGFTAKWNSPVDSANYFLSYVVLPNA